VIDVMRDAYPELEGAREYIRRVVAQEEARVSRDPSIKGWRSSSAWRRRSPAPAGRCCPAKTLSASTIPMGFRWSSPKRSWRRAA
jgi:Alanyl-tRNA synthetase